MALNRALLEALPQGAVILNENRVVSYNTAYLRHVLPALTVGERLPDPLDELLHLEEEEGTVEVTGNHFQFSRNVEGEECLLLLWKQTQGIGDKTLDDFFCRLRSELAVSGAGLDNLHWGDGLGEMKKAHYRAVRLLENMELLCNEGRRGEKKTLELVGYCQQLALETESLLKEADTTLTVVEKDYGLFVEGEEQLLQRLIMGLVANCIQRGGNQVTLQLARSKNRCKIAIWDNTQGVTDGLTPEQTLRRELLTLPDSLDIAVVRQLAKMLGGTVLVGKTAQGGVKVTVALPLVDGATLPMAAPDICGGERYSRLLLELCDVLPAEIFQTRNLI